MHCLLISISNHSTTRCCRLAVRQSVSSTPPPPPPPPPTLSFLLLTDLMRQWRSKSLYESVVIMLSFFCISNLMLVWQISLRKICHCGVWYNYVNTIESIASALLLGQRTNLCVTYYTKVLDCYGTARCITGNWLINFGCTKYVQEFSIQSYLNNIGSENIVA